MFLLDHKFLSGCLCTLKSKKPKKTFKKPKNLKTFSKKLGFFQPWVFLKRYALHKSTFYLLHLHDYM